ncbi:MAG: DNA mismatch repair endonuclease MutL [Clostridia bacterium]
MAKINILEPKVYNRIAAGEVVENPASVIKELVENSIDAGSTQVFIDITKGGTTNITVTDNGCGIEKEFVRTAFLPHATSKLVNENDLDAIKTLGFRGEALASIASVAQVEMTTKTANSDTGIYIELENGLIKKQSEVGSTNGTCVVVSNLFYNVPARAKFLKKDKTEESNITNLISRFILANPNISFKYIADGKTIYHSTGKDVVSAIVSVYGKDVPENLLRVEQTFKNFTISGYIGRPSFSKPNRTYQTLVVNGRYVINQTVMMSVFNAYSDYLMKRQYPFFVLYMSIPYNEVDVNVHPNKLDVRFETDINIFGCFYEAVSKVLDKSNYLTSATKQESFIDTSKVEKINERNCEIKSESIDDILKEIKFNDNSIKENTEIKSREIIKDILKMTPSENEARNNFGLGSKLLEDLNTLTDSNYNNEVNKLAINNNSTNAEQELFTESNDNMKIVGKVFNTYLLLEKGSSMYFIDQHAGHERINYEKFKTLLLSSELEQQYLLVPYIFSVNSTEYEFLSLKINALKEIGFDIDEFGTNTFRISAVPLVLSDIKLSEFTTEILSDMKALNSVSSLDFLKESLMQKACKASVRGGDDLSLNEINSLLNMMSKEKIKLSCPHGRPVVIELTAIEIEKWFKRIV